MGIPVKSTTSYREADDLLNSDDIAAEIDADRVRKRASWDSPQIPVHRQILGDLHPPKEYTSRRYYTCKHVNQYNIIALALLYRSASTNSHKSDGISVPRRKWKFITRTP
jgi:hypothetical protein